MKRYREIYKTTLKKKSCRPILTNPTLDETMYLRLKASKGSNASKANIDSTEKALKKLPFKVLDLMKPLLFLADRKKLKRKSKSDSVAIKVALRLWATLFRDIMKLRRRNILSSLPRVHRTAGTRWYLVWWRGPVWTKKPKKSRWRGEILSHLIRNCQEKKKTSSTKDQPTASSSQLIKSNNHSSSTPRDGFVSISSYSFGWRIISGFVDVWRQTTSDSRDCATRSYFGFYLTQRSSGSPVTPWWMLNKIVFVLRKSHFY